MQQDDGSDSGEGSYSYPEDDAGLMDYAKQKGHAK